MNDLLQLKGRFEQAKNTSRPGAGNIPSGKSVSVSKLELLYKNLNNLREYWIKDELIPGALVSVYYNKVAAKSNRVQGIFSKSGVTANSSIVGARFSDDKSPKHIITHYVSLDIINQSLKEIQKCIVILKSEFSDNINNSSIKDLNTKKIFLKSQDIARTRFVKIIIDTYYVEKFDIFVDNVDMENNSIITIFNTNVKAIKLMEKIGINLQFNRVMDDTTILLRPDELNLLKKRAPYLISMAVTDLTKIERSSFVKSENKIVSISPPTIEPVIGVIDTMFDENVYFSEWVDFTNMVSKDIELSPNDYYHGTAVSSIIVDGPSMNPHLDDGCGRFKVRHFGVAAGNQFSSFSILRSIDEIVASNSDIKVWNLSLGSKLEINKNFISPEAAILDKIQYENDVIFIIAGTNKTSNDNEIMRIGAPADSINSIVVNSVDFNNKSALYSRRGPVLSFFTKPDISYYGGTKPDFLSVCTPTGESFVCGTSFAAPWISRKMSYMIDILGFSREVAKALLINSATGWKKQILSMNLVGHGIVPVRIEDIINSPDDEIRFLLSGTSEEYDTYNYNIPIPINKDKHPFIAKATMCYFPCCSRNQGVDYTNTELDIQFGRITDKGIKPIDNNYQSSDSEFFTWEEDARKNFRKWDNVKHIREIVKENMRAKKCYDKGIWGLSLKTKERLEKKYGLGLSFGIVITLKEINGVNRIEEFVKNCALRGWLVNRIDVDHQIDVYNIAEEIIEFED
jgi:hypothetical protein